MLTVLADTGHAEFVIARVREAIEADPRVAGRLALWARRLVGEALGQAQRVAADGSRWPGCWRALTPASSATSAGCSPSSPTSTPPGWRRWALAAVLGREARRER